MCFLRHLIYFRLYFEIKFKKIFSAWENAGVCIYK